MQPDASVLNSAAQINKAINSENGDLTDSPRNYVSETAMETTEKSALINSDVQLPTPPRSENSPTSLSPREATAPPFTYDGLFPTAVPQPYAEWNSQALGVFESAASLPGAEELQVGAPQQFIGYTQAMTDYAVYAQQHGVEFTQQYAPPYVPPEATFSRAPQPFVATKRQPTSDSATVALFSPHVPVAGFKCKYTIRIRPADVGRFIGASGSRIRQLQLRTQTVVTVCYASSPAVAVPNDATAAPSAPAPVELEPLPNIESQPGLVNVRPTCDSQEASIPVVISGNCNCVMDALREIYFHFPFSDFRPIDVPSIVKSELQARTTRAGLRNSALSGSNNAVSNAVCNGQAQAASKESPAEPRRNAEKTSGNTKKKRKQKAKLAAQKAERDDASANRTENGLPNQSNSNSPLTNCDDVYDKLDSAQKVDGSSVSPDDRKSLLLNETVMQKSTLEGDKSAGNAPRGRADTGVKQQSAPSNRTMAAKKKNKAIDIESMKDFPPLAITGGPTGDGPRRSETADHLAKPTDSSGQDTVDGPIVEQTTRALRTLAVTCAADDARNACSTMPNGARTAIDGCYTLPFPVSNSPYGTVGPEMAQFGPPSAYAYPSYEYYPMEYYACQNYYQNGELAPNDYYTNAGAFMPQKGAYGDPAQYADQLSGMYAAAPGWNPDSAAFQAASQLGSMAYPSCSQLPVPFGVASCDGFEPSHTYDSPHPFGGPHWSAFVERCMSAQPPVDSNASPQSASAARTDVHASREPAVTQPTGILLSCRISSVAPPSSEDTLDACVQILVQTGTGAYVSRASDFVDSISHFYADAGNLATHRFVVAQNLVSGSLLAVRLADCKWYRAELLAHSEEQLRVRLIDFGNSVDLPLASHCVAKLADTFSVVCVPPMAVRCRVRTIRSLRTGIALNLHDAFAMLSDTQRVSSMGTYVRLSPRADAEESAATSNDAELYVDD